MIIVTGGAGFIGSNLVHGLNQRGIDDILVVDDLTSGEKHLGLNALRIREFVDYRDFPARMKAWEQPLEAVFHQGACSDTMEHDGRYMMRVNYEYSRMLLDFCQARCPFFYASSAAVYGNGDAGFREDPACESPLNVYAYSKMLFDQHVRRVLPQSKSQIVGLRYFNVYGPQENHKGRMASVIFKFHGQIQEQGAFNVFAGSDKFLRDFIYVRDVVDVNMHFLGHPDVSGIFNCGTGRSESFLQLAEHVAEHYVGAEIKEIAFPESLAGKYQAYTQADLSLLRQAGYSAEFTSLSEGVGDYVRLLRESGGFHRPAQVLDSSQKADPS